MISQVNFVNLVVVAETLAAIHLVAYYLPKRSHFALRTALSTLVCLAVGFVTPPVAGNLFVASGMTGIPMEKIAAKSVPLIVAMFIAAVIITYVPGVSLGILPLF